MGNKHTEHKGFTLVELLVALMVMSIILSAVASLSFALGNANDSSNDLSLTQAQLRSATLRLTELLKHSKLICGTPGDDLVVWRADDNDDGIMNLSELVYIERGSQRNYIRFLEFPSISGVLSISNCNDASVKPELIYYLQERYTDLFQESQCSNVEFVGLNEVVARSRFVSISFDIEEGGELRNYQINASLLSWAGNLLNADSSAIVDDDD